MAQSPFTPSAEGATVPSGSVVAGSEPGVDSVGSGATVVVRRSFTSLLSNSSSALLMTLA